MFDIGFAELVLIFIVGLLVLGPERLPAAIRTLSLWLGRLRRSFVAIRDEIEREIGADDIKRQLHNESIMSSLKETEDSVKDGFKSVEQEFRETQNNLKSLEYDISDAVKPPRTPRENDIAAKDKPKQDYE